MSSKKPKAKIKVEETEDDSFRINGDLNTLETSSNARTSLNAGDSQEPNGTTTRPVSIATMPQPRSLASIAAAINEARNSGPPSGQPAFGFPANDARNTSSFGSFPMGQATAFGRAIVQSVPN
ncbi:hypothetical protein DL98DRAFT_593736 [Cadophora sp. DSE1049]|nr:hypothetical protein DL98DRAFT_593736 [Cadophora sp. DSE1049]